jgi:hypothetical protein
VSPDVHVPQTLPAAMRGTPFDNPGRRLNAGFSNCKKISNGVGWPLKIRQLGCQLQLHKSRCEKRRMATVSAIARYSSA